MGSAEVSNQWKRPDRNQFDSTWKNLGHVLNKLTEIWIDSDFKMGKDQLLKVELPKITDNINKCPVTESNLQETNLVPRQKLIGVCLNKLTEIWIDSDFKIDKDQLLKVELPKIGENLLMQQSPTKKRKK